MQRYKLFIMVMIIIIALINISLGFRYLVFAEEIDTVTAIQALTVEVQILNTNVVTFMDWVAVIVWILFFLIACYVLWLLLKITIFRATSNIKL